MMNYAASRATQNPAIPSNQNTAPILDFRCLYTHDMRKKKKKWHDGVLRFHTFNKRIMVYDIPMNFIGDTHWRSSEVVQDGDEIELDRGVLIQVGEATGIKEQDISEVFAKRRPAQESPQIFPAQRPLPPSVASASAPLTQLRPKSLNELLGTPRGAYGRAAFPAKSPFEERRLIRINEAEQARHAKRRRIDASNIDPDDTEPMSSGHANADSSSPLLSRTGSTRSNKVASRSTSTATHNGITSDPKNPIPPALRNRSIAAKKAISTEPTESISVTCVTPAQLAQTKEARLHLAPSTPIPDRTPKFARSKDNQPVNPLRVAPRKIRRKLMYRELLPKDYHENPSFINPGIPVSNTIEGNTIGKTRESLGHEKNQSETLQMPFSSHQQQELAPESDHEDSLFVRQNDSNLNNSVLGRLDEAFLGRPQAPTITPSPVPPDITTAAPVLQGVRRSLLKFAMPTIPQAPPTMMHESTPEPSPQASTTLIPQSPPQSPRVPSSQPAHDSLLSQPPQPARPHSRYGNLNPGAEQDPPLQLPVLNPQNLQRPFQRVTSDITNTKAVPFKQPLRHSESDITDKSPLVPPVQIPVVEIGNDTGPWSREAFDLFGWRPGESKKVGVR